jgi:hypothetical protein
MDWLALASSINWPQVVVSLVLGGVITYFIQNWLQKRPHKSEFTITGVTTTTSETDTTSKSMQFQVGAKGDLQNVNIQEVVEAIKQALAEKQEDKDDSE